MAKYTPSAGIENITGALSKSKRQTRLTVTRTKSVRDPLTNEVVGKGHKEMYMQSRRDYGKKPMTKGEREQRGKWQEACREAPAIFRDKSHPRYMEFYCRWQEHLHSTDQPMHFLNFIRSVLSKEA